MNVSSVELIADAVLFEGYMLYPYRPSSLKNLQRWNFGTLYPRIFADAQLPPERWRFRVQLLLQAAGDTTLSARVRFLQQIAGGNVPNQWDQSVVRAPTLESLRLSDLTEGIEEVFHFPISSADLAGVSEQLKMRMCRGRLTLRAECIRHGLYQLNASFANESDNNSNHSNARSPVHDAAFVSAHLLVAIEGGTFISLLDPPPEFQADAASCVQDGVFPVLAGDVGAGAAMLCSPIILYDYPQVAPESAGNFFDATEMDEMLALRVLTLTEEEKDEMRRSDPLARALLERTETLSDEQFARVHGAVRGLRRVTGECSSAVRDVDLISKPFDPFAEHPQIQSIRIFGLEVRVGDRVRLWPDRTADILDMAMKGKIAVIEAIEQDLDDRVQLAVVLEDDPGRDMGMLRQAGHRFFFSPEEVEPVGVEAL